MLAYAYRNTGSPERALEWSECAVVLAEGLDDTELLARAVGTRSGALFNLGRHREAVMLARGMATLADAAGALREQATARLGLSLYGADDDPRESLSAGAEAAELARRAGHRGLEVMNLLNAAETSLFVGEWSDTRAAIAEVGQRELPARQRSFLDCVRAIPA